MEATQHLQQRMSQRGIQADELQAAVEHGVRSVDTATGNQKFRHRGVTYVTDESGTVGLTAYVDDEHAHDDERPALLVFMPCEGRCITQSFPAWQGRDAYGAAGPFAVRCGIRAKLYYLAIIPAARGAQCERVFEDTVVLPTAKLAVILEGQNFDVSPLCAGDRMRQFACEDKRTCKRMAAFLGTSAMKWKYDNAVFSLAMQLSMGLGLPAGASKGGGTAGGGDPRSGGAQSRETLKAASAAARWPEGTKVLIDGLKSKTDLNQTEGVVRSFNKGKGRYVVVLPNDDTVRLKPENIARLGPDPALEQELDHRGGGFGGLGGLGGVEDDDDDGGYGEFSAEDVDELLSQGVKPWDEDAGAVLDALSGGGGYSDDY